MYFEAIHFWSKKNWQVLEGLPGSTSYEPSRPSTPGVPGCARIPMTNESPTLGETEASDEPFGAVGFLVTPLDSLETGARVRIWCLVGALVYHVDRPKNSDNKPNVPRLGGLVVHSKSFQQASDLGRSPYLVR